MQQLKLKIHVYLTFLFVFLPETKGKSLEQMYTYFEKITGGDFGAALSASEGGQPALA